MSIEQSGSGKTPDRKTGFSNLDKYPGPEDWDALQGGRPRVFRNPHRPNSRWIILHVYDERPDYKHRFVSGIVVETLADKTGNVSDYLIQRKDWDDNNIERVISIPPFMYRKVHGDRCNQRSSETNGGQYSRVRNQESYEAYIESLTEEGYQELEFKVSKDNQFLMQPLPEIRSARPLLEATDF